jgi:hypothetical protein
MGRKLYLPLVIVLTFVFSNAFSQTGEIRGRVIEKGGTEGVPFASVAALQGGAQVLAGVTDIDGNYVLKPLTPGRYDVKVTSVGYSPAEMKNVLVTVDNISYANVDLSKGIELKAVEVVEYERPLIDKGNPAVNKTIDYEEIQAAPLRDINSVASTTAAVFQEDAGKNLNVRGSRSDATAYYVDGIKVRGSQAVASKSAEQITVITGGLPAQYGDATGGVISITTRGPSKEWNAGIEASSSKFFDEYNNNTLSMSLSGPIYTKRDAEGKKSGQPVVGFFLAGDYNYDDDPSPSAIGAYKVKDDVLEDIRRNPLVKSLNNVGFDKRAEFLTMDDLEKTKARANVWSEGYTVNGKLDFKILKNLGLSIGGSYANENYRDYTKIYALMNYDENDQFLKNTARGFVKFTQRFAASGDAQKSASAIKGGYFSIQGDYTQYNETNQNERHEDNIWNYGYVGQFTTLQAPSYQSNGAVLVSGDSVPGLVAYVDTQFNYVASDLNPYTSAYTSQYYSLAPERDAYWNNISQVTSQGGLVSGDNRLALSAYSVWATPGRIVNGYSKQQTNQFSIKAQGVIDIKSHSIGLGMEYEQRSDYSYVILPKFLWSLARQYGNQQLGNLDTSSPIINPNTGGSWVFIDNQLVFSGDTLVNYNYAYNPTTTHSLDSSNNKAPGFFENLRDRMFGDGTQGSGSHAYNQWVDMDHITPDFYQKSVNLFAPDQLLDPGIMAYYGYDYLGNKISSKPSLNDYFYGLDGTNNYSRQWGAFEPIYVAGYIQDRFALNDIIFNIGLRVDRFDANQPALKDKYLLYPAYTAGDENVTSRFTIPSNIKGDYVVYVNDSKDPSKILGFRNEDKWYDADGNATTDVKTVMVDATSTGTIQPWLIDANKATNKEVDLNAFKDYEAQTSFMPRIAFSFPISDEANFKAHYDILTQRPQDINLVRFNPQNYLNYATSGTIGTISNPDLKPERTTDYEIEFEQRLTRSSAFKISAFYRELHDMIQIISVQYAYPATYSTYGNVDFGTVKGLSLSYEMRRTGNVRLDASYTLQFADGTGSDPNANAGLLAQLGQANFRTPLPLNFDQRHTITTTFDYHYGFGKNYDGPIWFGKQVFSNAGINFVFRGSSGRPYTRQGNITPDEITGLNLKYSLDGSLNGSRKPWNFRIDAKVDKGFTVKTGKKANGESRRGFDMNVYIVIINVLDTRNVIGIYRATGSPDDDGYLTDPTVQTALSTLQPSPQSFRDLYTVALLDPAHYSLPRRARLGIQINF